MELSANPVARIWNLMREQKRDIGNIYLYALVSGFIQLSLPVGIQSIIGFIIAGSLSASLVVLVGLIVTGVLLVGIMQMLQMRVSEKIQQAIFVKYAFAFADRIPRLDLKKADPFYLPELVNRFFETVTLQKGISKLVLDLPLATIQILLGLILLSFYHPVFILFGVLLIAVLALILYVTGTNGLNTSLSESRFKYALAGWLEETARAVKSFKFAGDSGLHIQKADERTVSYLQARTKHFSILLFQYKILIVFKVLITAAMLIVGIMLLLNQQMNIGQFVAAEIIILTVINAVEKVIINLDSVYDVLTAVEKISKLTEKPIEVGGTQVLFPSEGVRLHAQNLQFGYDDKPVLQSLSFEIAKADKVCISGDEGKGKSTLLKILAGVHRDINGSLLINDVPIGNYDIDSLRKKTGIFFLQENIFQGTLKENLTMGRDANESYLHHLAAVTGLQTYIQSLPLGYDTELDPAGKRLPYNTVQKILWVRALVHKPEIVLAEEPWKGADEVYKQKIIDHLMNLKNTTVVIATNDTFFQSKANKIIQL